MYSVKAHSQIVNAIDGVGGLGIGEGAPEIVTASRDGKLHIHEQAALEGCSAFRFSSWFYKTKDGKKVIEPRIKLTHSTYTTLFT